MSYYKIKKEDTPSSLGRTNSAPKYFHDDTSDSPRYHGVYIGIVKNTQDAQHMGRLQVFMPDWGGDEDNRNQWRTVSYCAPFGGSSPAMERFWDKDVDEYDYTPTSYGFWAVPPDVGNKVLVMFINGDPARGIWVGVLYDNFMNFNVPGLAAYDKHNNKGDTVHKFQNVTEYNKFNHSITNPLTPEVRPYHKRQYERMSQTAQHEDPYRGWTTSSAQRETPSAVYGMSTPGPIDPAAFAVGETFKRAGGHQFVMDDGDVDGNNRLIRLRARGGAQLLIHDTLGFVYICNKMGTAWVELDKNGNVEVFSNNSISLRANEDINMRADRDFNLDIGRDLNVYMPADYATNEEKKFQLDLHAGGGGPPGTPDINFQYSKVSGLKDVNPEGKHTVPNGSIVLQVKEGQVHTTIETGSAFHTMGIGDYNHRLENGSYLRTINSGIFNGRTASNHFQKVGGRSLLHTEGMSTIVSDSMLTTSGMLGVQHFSGGDMNIKVDKNLVAGSGSNMHFTSGTEIASDAPEIYHNSNVAKEPTGQVVIDFVFAANRAKEILTQEFEDMVKYDPKKGPTTKKVERRLTRYPTMEPYGGLISNPGEGTLYHIDDITTVAFAGVTGDPVQQVRIPIDLEEQELLVGKSTPTNGGTVTSDTISPDRQDASIIPDSISGQPRPEFSEGQYVGTHYDAQGNPHYEKVADAIAAPASQADCSGKGTDLIKSKNPLTQTAQTTEAGEEHIGYGHVLNKEKQQQASASDITAQAKEILLRNTEALPPFGKALIGSEVVSWASKTANKLLGVTRGLDGTTTQAHAKGATFTFSGESYPDGITRQQADALFDNDVKQSVTAVRKSVKANINQNQADSLVSLAHTLGPTAFANSTVVSAINSSNFAQATTEFMRYNKITKNVITYNNGSLVKTPTTVIDPGQTRQRVREAKMFSTPPTATLRTTVNNRY